MHYFIDTYGSKGVIQFKLTYEEKKLYGYPASVMREIAEKISEKASERNIRTDIIHCFLDNGIKGITFPELNKCITNILPYEERGLINSLDSGYVSALRELGYAETHFRDALKIHDEWEKYYIDNLNYEILDAESKRFRERIILKSNPSAKEGSVIDRFLGAATSFGAVDYIENITADVKKRYFIKGRPGTGKSTFLKKLINDAVSCGYNAERYHCAFDPDSIDMAVIRGLDIAVFDSTAPHEHFPTRESDEILDFYSLAAKRDIDTDFKEKLYATSARYKEKINMATDSIARCNNIFKQNEKSTEERIDRKNLLCLIEVLSAEIFG